MLTRFKTLLDSPWFARARNLVVVVGGVAFVGVVLWGIAKVVLKLPVWAQITCLVGATILAVAAVPPLLREVQRRRTRRLRAALHDLAEEVGTIKARAQNYIGGAMVMHPPTQ